MSEQLNSTEVIIETLQQCIDWARENLEEEISDLTDCETFWETSSGIEGSVSSDMLEEIEKAIGVIHRLSDFINRNTDHNRCLPEGMPSLALSPDYE